MENVKGTEEAREAKTRIVLINKIIDRAAELGIMYSSRLSHSMDINYAVQVFDIDLKAWLDSTNNDFIHDYVGIYKNIDRDAISSKHFVLYERSFLQEVWICLFSSFLIKLKSDVNIPKARVFWIDLGSFSALVTGEVISPNSSCFISNP